MPTADDFYRSEPISPALDGSEVGCMHLLDSSTLGLIALLLAATEPVRIQSDGVTHGNVEQLFPVNASQLNGMHQ